MESRARHLAVRLLASSLFGLAVAAAGASVVHASPSMGPLAAAEVVADDPPVDDGTPTGDGADGSSPEPTPESSNSQAPATPEDDQNSGTNQSESGNHRDSGKGQENQRSHSDDRSTSDEAVVPTVPSSGESPVPTPSARPKIVLVTEHGPSPLGWLALAAGLVCAGAAGAVYVRYRPFDGPADGSELADVPAGVGALGPDTEELDVVHVGGGDPLQADTKEMHVVPLGVDAPPVSSIPPADAAER